MAHVAHSLLRNFQGHHIVYEMKPRLLSVEERHVSQAHPRLPFSALPSDP